MKTKFFLFISQSTFEVNNGSTRTSYENFSKLPKKPSGPRSGVFNVIFEQKIENCSGASIVSFEQVNVGKASHVNILDWTLSNIFL